MTAINKVYSVSMDSHPDARIFFANFTFPNGEVADDTYVSYPDPNRVKGDPRDLNQMFQQWLDDNEGKYDLIPYTPAPPLTPEEARAEMRPLTPREFRDALIDNDIMPDQVTSAIEAIPDVKARAKAINAWEYPTQFVRNDPLIDTISLVFNLTPERIDEMWKEVTG